MTFPITAGILAGGRGQRMGGIDKGLFEFDGKPLIEQLIGRLAPQAPRLIINANRNLERYRGYGYPVVSDPLDDFQGPLAGFAALLEACDDPWLAIAPCDSPLLPPDYLQRLHRSRQQSGCRIVVAHDGERMQPAHALIDRRLIDDLRLFLALGERKISRWYDRHRWAAADFSDVPATFINLNRPTDCARLGASGT